MLYFMCDRFQDFTILLLSGTAEKHSRTGLCCNRAVELIVKSNITVEIKTQ